MPVNAAVRLSLSGAGQLKIARPLASGYEVVLGPDTGTQWEKKLSDLGGFPESDLLLRGVSRKSGQCLLKLEILDNIGGTTIASDEVTITVKPRVLFLIAQCDAGTKFHNHLTARWTDLYDVCMPVHETLDANAEIEQARNASHPNAPGYWDMVFVATHGEQPLINDVGQDTNEAYIAVLHWVNYVLHDPLVPPASGLTVNHRTDDGEQFLPDLDTKTKYDGGLYEWDDTADYGLYVDLIDAARDNNLYRGDYIDTNDDGEDFYKWHAGYKAGYTHVDLDGYWRPTKIKVGAANVPVSDLGLTAGLQETHTYFFTCWNRWLDLPAYANIHRVRCLGDGETLDYQLEWDSGGSGWPIKVEAGSVKLIDRIIEEFD